MKVRRYLIQPTNNLARWWWYLQRLHTTTRKATARACQWPIEVNNFILMNVPNFYVKWTNRTKAKLPKAVSILDGPVHLHSFENKLNLIRITRKEEWIRWKILHLRQDYFSQQIYRSVQSWCKLLRWDKLLVWWTVDPAWIKIPNRANNLAHFLVFSSIHLNAKEGLVGIL